jgi:hypothetical protein
MVEEFGGGGVARACSRLRLRCGTSLVTTTQASTACLMSSPKWPGGGGVLCRVRLFMFRGLLVWWCPLRRVMYQLLLLLK